MKAGSKIMLQQ